MKSRLFWHQSHNDVIQKVLRKARKGTHVVFVPGNHDEAVRPFCGLALRRHRHPRRSRCTAPPTAAGCW